jgi:hypothetical protein
MLKYSLMDGHKPYRTDGHDNGRMCQSVRRLDNLYLVSCLSIFFGGVASIFVL